MIFIKLWQIHVENIIKGIRQTLQLWNIFLADSDLYYMYGFNTFSSESAILSIKHANLSDN